MFQKGVIKSRRCLVIDESQTKSELSTATHQQHRRQWRIQVLLMLKLTLARADPQPQWSQKRYIRFCFLSVELSSDDTSATGSRQSFAPV